MNVQDMQTVLLNSLVRTNPNNFLSILSFFYTVHGLINVYATTRVFILYIYLYFLKKTALVG